MMTAVAQLIATIVLLSYALCSHAQVYRCVDNSGHVKFSQQPCGPAQQGEKVNLDGADVNRKPKPRVCKQVEKLAGLIFPHINDTDSILDIYSNLGGRAVLSAGVTAAVNYVFNFRFNPKARQTDVVALTYAKCLDGGFGQITQTDLPDWDNIQYVKDAAKAAKQAELHQLKECKQYDDKIIGLRQRLKTAKGKSVKLQARVDLEYLEGLRRDKCGSRHKAKQPKHKQDKQSAKFRQPGPDQ
jgi:hypothetical protein